MTECETKRESGATDQTRGEKYLPRDSKKNEFSLKLTLAKVISCQTVEIIYFEVGRGKYVQRSNLFEVASPFYSLLALGTL